MSAKSTTTFTSRGTAHRPDPRRGAGRHGPEPRQPRPPSEPGRASADEALYYRARLILGESLPRPSR